MSRTAFREFIHENHATLPRPRPAPQVCPSATPPGQDWAAGGDPAPETPTADAPSGARLPEYKRASDIVPAKIVTPEILIDGLLHRGCKLILSGGSKSFKSWVLMDQAVSIAHGIPWWGLNCKRGRVLYINFELIDSFFEERLVSVCRARGVDLPQSLFYWNLRGHCYDLEVLAKVILARVAMYGQLDLIVVDPIYKALGDLDENKASDMTKLMNLIESITVQTGSAVVFGSHFSKGNQAAKEAKDRPSGSGVLIRDPDAILTMTRHQEDQCFVVNSELRYLPPRSEFVVRWTFPIMQADESLDPRQLYVPGTKSDDGETNEGGPNTFSETDVLDCLPVSGGQDGLWRKMVNMKFGRSGPAYYAAKGSLIRKGLVLRDGQRYFRTQLKFDPQAR